MQQDNYADVQRGMSLAASLPDIMPDQVSDRLMPVYQDIQDSLRVPIVNKIFRTLANYPEYLEAAWAEIRPVIRSYDFERCADALRQQALLDEVPQAPILSLFEVNDADTLAAFNDTIHYVLPKLLLAVTALHQASFGTHESAWSVKPVNEEFDAGAATGSAKVRLVNPDDAEERVKALFEEVKARHGHPLVSSYYRGMANWPDFLERAWHQLQHYVGTGAYAARRSHLTNLSQTFVSEWNFSKVTVPEDQQENIRCILRAFGLKFIPEMLLDAVLVKCFLNGPQAAVESKFSAICRRSAGV